MTPRAFAARGVRASTPDTTRSPRTTRGTTVAAYTAADVKALREKTGAGMLDCKNALVESEGDVEKAIELLRIKGQKGVAKREDRDASNGLVVVHTESGLGVMVQLNCETDFVAKSEGFVALAQQVLDQAVAVQGHRRRVPAGLRDRRQDRAGGPRRGQRDDGREDRPRPRGPAWRARTSRPTCTARRATCRRRSASSSPSTASDEEVGKDVAMHAAAMSPVYLTRDEVPGGEGRERAPHRRGDLARREQARGRPARRSSRGG